MSGYNTWNPATTYSANDIVNFGGALYVSLLTPNLNHQPNTSITFWAVIGGGGAGSGVQSISAGAGILLSGGTSTPTITANLQNGTGIAITTGTGTQRIISAVGVQNITVGAGLSTTGGETPQLVNTGVITATAGDGINITGTASAPVITNVGVQSLAVGTGISTTGGQTPTITNTGVITVAAGTGISSTGGQTPTIANTGVLGLTAGTNITIGGTPQNPIISSSGSGSGSPVRVSLIPLPGNDTFPISGGATGTQLFQLNGGLAADFAAGTSPDLTGVWVIDMSPFTMLLTGNTNSGFVQIGMSDTDPADAGLVYNGESPQTFGSAPTSYNLLNSRSGGCGAFILKVSSVLTALPNFNSSLKNFFFTNGSSDVCWLQTRPTFLTATYFPLGL